MMRRPLAVALLLAALGGAPAAGAATATLTVRDGFADGPAKLRPAADGVPRWAVTYEQGVGVRGTYVDDLGLVPFDGRCHLVVTVIATGRSREAGDCYVEGEGVFEGGFEPTQHVRIAAVIEPTSEPEHPIAAPTSSPPVEVRVRASVVPEDITTAGRLLDGRLVIRFAAQVVVPGARGGRVLLQRKAGQEFVNVASRRPDHNWRATFRVVRPKRGQYRFLWVSGDRKRWDDTPSRLQTLTR
jgi:hypothetical protein